MKRFLSALLLLCSASGMLSAQTNSDFYGVFNHVGVNVSSGTEGIGLAVAAPVTPYLEVGMGLNFMPGLSMKADVSVNEIKTGHLTIQPNDVTLKGDFARTMGELKVNCYPFGGHNALFVSAGLSFGGAKLVKLTGHSDDVQNVIADHPELKDKIFAEIDKYNVQFNEHGDIHGSIRVNAVRPYLGLGYGRQMPRHRVGFRFEMGCQFQGRMKVYQGNSMVETSDLEKASDDFSDLIKKFTIYPVMKFTLTGRIL